MKNPLVAAVVDSLSADLKGAEKLSSADVASSAPTLGSEIDRIGSLHPRAENLFDCFIFDQFEEVLTLPGVSEEERVSFFKELGLALEKSDRWAVFAIRDDYLGALEPYLRYLPTQLSTRLRLTQLTCGQAQDAIVKLSERSTIHFTPDAAEKTAGELASADGSVEPVYLQVACRHLWSHSEQLKRSVVEIEDVTLLNHVDAKRGAGQTPVEQAIRTYYDECIAAVAGADQESQGRLRNWFGTELIELTSRGERRRQTLWASDSVVKPEELEALQNRYLIRQDHRDGVWVELAHDRLLGPIIESNNQWNRLFRQPWQDTADRWQTSGRDPALLLVDGQQLAEAEKWAAGHTQFVAPHDRDFLDKCRTEARFRLRVRRTVRASMAAAALVIVVAAIAFGFAIVSQKTAVQAQRQADVATRTAQTEREAALNAKKEADSARSVAREAEAAAAVARQQAKQDEILAAKYADEARTARQQSDKAIQESTSAEVAAKYATQRAEEDRSAAVAAIASAEEKTLQSERSVSEAKQVALALRSFGLGTRPPHAAAVRGGSTVRLTRCVDRQLARARRNGATAPGSDSRGPRHGAGSVFTQPAPELVANEGFRTESCDLG